MESNSHKSPQVPSGEHVRRLVSPLKQMRDTIEGNVSKLDVSRSRASQRLLSVLSAGREKYLHPQASLRNFKIPRRLACNKKKLVAIS